MASFLTKIGSQHCPDEIGIPRREAEWSKDFFNIKKARPVDGTSDVSELSVGDTLYVWVHETDGGSGLTARGTISSVHPADESDSLLVWLADLELLPPPKIDFYYFRRHAFSGSWKTLQGFVLRQTIELDDIALSEIEAALTEQRRELESYELDDQSKPSGPISISDTDHPSIAAERERIWTQIERRQNQGEFRSALLAEYGSRCTITRTACKPVLEAAHIVPFAAGRPNRDHPANGLLLRADIHTLFDRGLIAIDPDELLVWIAPAIEHTAYKRLAGKVIATTASKACLKTHYDWARSLVAEEEHEI